jgi:hypothetical protein
MSSSMSQQQTTNNNMMRSIEALLQELVQEEYVDGGGGFGSAATATPRPDPSARRSARARAEEAAVLALPSAAPVQGERRGDEYPLYDDDPEEFEAVFAANDDDYYDLDADGGHDCHRGIGHRRHGSRRHNSRLERHHQLVRHLKQTGMFSSLSAEAQWGLFAVGQQLCVFEELMEIAASNSASASSSAAAAATSAAGDAADDAERKSSDDSAADMVVMDWLSELDVPYRTLGWFESLEANLYRSPPPQTTEDDEEVELKRRQRWEEVHSRLDRPFVRLLCAAVKAAYSYQEQELQSLYGLSDSVPPLLRLSTEAPEGSVVAPHRTEQQKVSSLVSPLWTCRDELREILRRQLERWGWRKKDEEPPPSKPPQPWPAWKAAAAETVAIAALRSFQDACELLRVGAHGEDDDDDQKHPQQKQGHSSRRLRLQQEYASVQELAVSVLREAFENNDDELAWKLSVEHSYFGGLCDMARSHERRPDRSQYRLDPLFRHFNGKNCAASPALPFCHYVLQWHADRKLWGHVLEYGGKYCPGALTALLDSPTTPLELRRLAWVHAVYQGDYDRATGSLVANVKDPLSTLQSSQVDLACAKLANRVALAAGTAGVAAEKQRRTTAEIDTLRMLAQAQEELLAMTASQGGGAGAAGGGGASDPPPMSPHELLRLVLDRASTAAASPTSDKPTAPAPEELARLLLLGLRACSALHDGDGNNDFDETIGSPAAAASEVWLEAIRLSLGWLQDAFATDREEEPSLLPPSPLSADLVRALKLRTVFGVLLAHVLEETSYDDATGTPSSRLLRRVAYHRADVEGRVRQALGESTNLTRGLRSFVFALESELPRRNHQQHRAASPMETA